MEATFIMVRYLRFKGDVIDKVIFLQHYQSSAINYFTSGLAVLSVLAGKTG